MFMYERVSLDAILGGMQTVKCCIIILLACQPRTNRYGQIKHRWSAFGLLFATEREGRTVLAAKILPCCVDRTLEYASSLRLR